MSRNKSHDCIDNYTSEYKKLEGFDFDYYVTKDGRVWTDCRKNGIERFMKIQTSKDGYKCVGLRIDGKQKLFRVHRLVAMAFIPNPENKPYINHIDGNRTNNNVENLEWCTQKENVDHAINVLGRWSQSEKQSRASQLTGYKNRHLTMKEAREIRELYASGKYSSLKLAKMYGISKPCTLRIIHNKSYKEESVEFYIDS